ncbi:MAG: hypothetical protein JW997_01300 [Actinobacteria bacterium]|nr:hypothetical protein [Actinomycetota bacterium]
MPESFENTDKVSKKIIDDASQEAKEIIDNAKKKADEIIEAAKKERESTLAAARSYAQDKYRKIYELEIAKAKSAMEQEVLMQKISIIDEIIDISVNKLINEESESYKIFIKKNFEALNIKSGEYQIGNREKFITDDTLKKISGFSKMQKSEKRADFDFGIKIIEDKKEYSISAETLVNTNIDDIRMELARFLFEKE